LRNIFITIACFFSLFVTAQTAEELSVTFIKKLERQKFDSCYAMLDTVVTNKISSGMLEQMWGSMPRYMGEYKGFSDITTEEKDSILLTYVLCSFEKMKINLQFAYHNPPSKIIGFFFTPPKNKTVYSAPDYVQPHKFYETKLAVKTGTMSLPGALCIPNHTKNPPVVLLLAGSGPNDKDETIGPNKPLKDIATGLASLGIATFRYDKRTLVYGKELSANYEKVGLFEEVIEDALNAIKTIRAFPDLKISPIFIAGHSLGAMCAPLIASKSKEVKGIVLLAGNARPLEDLILEQVKYLASQDSLSNDDIKELDTLQQQVARVKQPKILKNSKKEELPLGLPSYYWQSLNKYHQVEVAKKLKQPVLVVQGERDYQVTMKDFELWKQALGDKPKNKFMSYPDLNHLLLPGKEKSWPQEYQIQGNVSQKLITDMADWIKSQK